LRRASDKNVKLCCWLLRLRLCDELKLESRKRYPFIPFGNSLYLSELTHHRVQTHSPITFVRLVWRSLPPAPATRGRIYMRQSLSGAVSISPALNPSKKLANPAHNAVYPEDLRIDVKEQRTFPIHPFGAIPHPNGELWGRGTEFDQQPPDSEVMRAF
jgi:hypothetical protein